MVVGDAQTLSIIKSVTTIDGGPAIAGATLDYTVSVRNVGNVPALYVTLTDDLDAINPGYLEYVGGSATLNGLTNGVAIAGTLITADYFNTYGALAPGEAAAEATIATSTHATTAPPSICFSLLVLRKRMHSCVRTRAGG